MFPQKRLFTREKHKWNTLGPAPSQNKNESLWGTGLVRPEDTLSLCIAPSQIISPAQVFFWFLSTFDDIMGCLCELQLFKVVKPLGLLVLVKDGVF